MKEDKEVRLEPQKSWDVTRMETSSKITSSKNKSKEGDVETDEDLKGWRKGYISYLEVWMDREKIREWMNVEMDQQINRQTHNIPKETGARGYFDRHSIKPLCYPVYIVLVFKIKGPFSMSCKLVAP